MKRNLFAVLLLTTFVFQTVVSAQSVSISSTERKIAEGVTAKQLSDYLHFVASDEMEGRDTPSRGLDLTAKFIAMNMSSWGLKPAGDNGTYFQKIAIKSESTDPVNNALKIGEQSFAFLDDFFRLQGNTSVSSPAVFVRDGWMIKAKGIDAYKGVDVKDKIVVVYGQGFPRGNNATNIPAGASQGDLTGTKGTDWADPLTYAKNSGAKGMILIASPQAESAWGQIKGFLSRGNTYPEKLREASAGENDFPVMLVSGKVGDAILSGESGKKDSTVSFAVNKTVAVKAAAKIDIKWSQNVVAIFEGSDPVLKNEMVAIGAHYDHVGINPNAKGDDKIFNGADDDGSGTVAVLAIAEAFAKAAAKPKRSVLFVWHCGEEKGLWGSEYFNKFPTVDIKQVVAQLNLDMIGRSKKPGYMAPCDTSPAPGRKPCNESLSGEEQIYVIGKDMMSSTLGNLVSSVNSGYLNLNYDTRYDDPKDPNQFFFRSDHFNYAVNGIPVVFWFDGEHEDYHGVGDHPDKIDYNKMEKVSRTILITLLKLTDLKERPKVDKTLPPELTRR